MAERQWANTDPALDFNGATPRSTWPRWRNVYDYLLKVYDYEAAEIVKIRNLISDECAASEHDDCPIPTGCSCPHHSSMQLALEHPRLRSLKEAQG